MSNLHFKDTIFQEYLNTPNHELILPSLIIAQGILESNNGKSGLAIEANNLFGVKGIGDAGSVKKDTKEWSKEKGWYTIKADFRKYSSISKALEDQIIRFTTMSRYKKLIGEKDYKKAAQYVWEAGYATSPIYVEQLIKIIEQYQLYKYDEIVNKPKLPTWAVKPTEKAIHNLANKNLLAKDSISTHLNQSEWTIPVPKYLFWIMLDRLIKYIEGRRK
jgi:flagellum-specific peptidoglycan hydrolase FlgJ